MKVYLYPEFAGPDKGEGGVRRVVEAQLQHLPAEGIEFTSRPEEADIIASHILFPRALLKLGKPLVLHCHGLYWSEYDWHQWALEANEEVMAAIRVADLITVPTEWVAHALRRHTCRDIRVVPHGVDTALWELTPSFGYVFWDKSRPDPVCNPAAMNDVASRLTEVPFISTYGEPAPNVQLVGRLPHDRVKELMRRAGVYLATTRETGQGISVLEALAAGVPVAGFRWGGVAETVEHGVSGYLAEPGDFQDLADGVQWCLKNREKLSIGARMAARRYDWPSAAMQYASLYEEVLERRTRDRPRVSVIVTAFKLEKYLAGCLASVLAQTSTDWECIVVDDASPDGCGEIAEQFAEADPRFRVIHNETNQYLAESRNIGVRASRGRYILPLDADDELAPAALQLLADALDTDPTLHMAYGNVLFVEEDGREWHSGWPVDFNLEDHFARLGQPGPYSVMMRREVLELTGGYRSRCRSSEDQDVWLRAPSYGFRPAYITRADTLIYRNRSGSMSQQQGWRNHRPWYPWVQNIDLIPAGAVTAAQMPIHSCDPIGVSVVIPVGPGHELLCKDAVDSVDAQTFRQWEVIVVNDTGHDLPELPVWVRQLRTAGGLGVAAARNIGIRASHAPLFVPLDADDMLQPQFLELALVAFHRGEDSPVVYTDWYEDPLRAYPSVGAFPPEGVALKTDERGAEYWEPDGAFVPFQARDYNPELLLHGVIHAVTALYPKALWEKVGGFDEQIVAWEDWDFALKTAEIGWPERRLALPLWTYSKRTGHRRNHNYGNFAESRAAILARWNPYWTGEKTMAPCSSCANGGKNQTMRSMDSAGAAMRQEPAPEDWVQIMPVWESQGPQTWLGPVTRKTYRFQKGREQYVDPRDAQGFLSHDRDFRLQTAGSQAALVAAGVTSTPLMREGPPSAPFTSEAPEPAVVRVNRTPDAAPPEAPDTVRSILANALDAAGVEAPPFKVTSVGAPPPSDDPLARQAPPPAPNDPQVPMSDLPTPPDSDSPRSRAGRGRVPPPQ